jgi:hypothetical protein
MKRQISLLLLLYALSHQAVFAQPKQTGEDRAIAFVIQRKEVKDWMKELETAKKQHKHPGNAGFMVTDHHGSIYTVQVFESFPDHNATFNWYTVDLKTGKVKQDLPE